MEVFQLIHQIIIESVSGGFWKFMGYWIMIIAIFGIPATLIAFAINRPLRHWTIREHGYPPSHCDADGNLKEDGHKVSTCHDCSFEGLF